MQCNKLIQQPHPLLVPPIFMQLNQSVKRMMQEYEAKTRKSATFLSVLMLSYPAKFVFRFVYNLPDESCFILDSVVSFCVHTSHHLSPGL